VLNFGGLSLLLAYRLKKAFALNNYSDIACVADIGVK